MLSDGSITGERSGIAPQSPANALPRLEIFTLGSLALRLDQRPLPPFHSRKAEALLVYLACTRQAHARELLADMFWDERSQTRAATNLRTLLASMRQTLSPYLHITRHTIGFNTQSDYWLDAQVFEQWSERYHPSNIAQLESAVALYRGDFLQGFFVRDSPRFEEWMLMQQERLQRKLILALHALVSHCLAQGEYTRGIEWASRLLQQDAFEEQAHQQLLKLLALSGQPSAALSHYESLQRLFAAQLGVAPARETTRLYEQIRTGNWRLDAERSESDKGRLPLDRSTSNQPPISNRPLTPFVGPETQRAALTDLLRQAVSGQSRLALIAGEAGIGKSRLVAEVKAIAAQSSAHILQGRCFEEDRTFPYAPLVDLLRTFCAGRSADELAHAFGATAAEIIKLFPELATHLPHVAPTPALEPELEKRRLFQTLVQFVVGTTTSRESPLLLIFEDLHWCDNTSLEWLLAFARQLAANAVQRVLVLLTYRDDEVQPALNSLLAALDRMPFVSEMKLSRLTRAETDAMLRAILNPSFASHVESRAGHVEFLDALYELTDGNPFFIEEVLKSLMAAGSIYQEGSEWTYKALNELRIPRTLQVAVQQRTRQLSAEARYLLTLAAVIGQRFDLRVLQAAAQFSENQVLQQVKELQVAQLVVEETDETFVFRHALTRQAIDAALLTRERMTLHRIVAEAIERCCADVIDMYASELAHHFDVARAWEKAMHWAQRAGDNAARLYAHGEALSHYTRARRCAERLGQPAQVAALDQAIGKVHQAHGELPQAIDAYTRALHATTDPARRAVLKAEIGAAYMNIGDERGLPYLQDALDELNPETQTRQVALATLWLGRSHNYRAQYTQALIYLERARQLSEPLHDTPTLRLVYSFMADALALSANFTQGMEWARRAVVLGEAQRDWQATALGYASLAINALYLGRCQEADEWGQRTREYAQRAGWLNVDVWGALQCAYADYYRGNLQAGAQLARDCLRRATELHERRAMLRATRILVALETALGNEETAAALGAQAIRDADALKVVPMRCGCRIVLAGLHMQRADWRRASELYEQCVALLEGTDGRVYQMELGAPLAEAYSAQGRFTEAARLIADTLSLTQATDARHYEAVAWRVQGQLCAAQGKYDDARRAFDQAIALCEAMGSRLELAHTLYQRGALHHAQHELESARAAWTRVRTLCGHMMARSLLWRTDAALSQLALTQQHEAESNCTEAHTSVAA